MLDISWTELLVIAIVAIVVVGPKDLPRMLRAVGKMVQKVKRTAAEFQGHFNEAMREAELEELRNSVKEIGKIDPMAETRVKPAPAKPLPEPEVQPDVPPVAAHAESATPDAETPAVAAGEGTKP